MMERTSKSGSGRGGKSKTPLYPSDLFALGSKTTNEVKSRPASASLGPKVGPVLSGPDKKRDASSVGFPFPVPKKPKVTLVGIGRADSTPPDAWESLAVDIDPGDFASQVLEAIDADDSDTTVSYICGAIKAIKNSRSKTDVVIFESLCYLAKIRPKVFCSDPVVSAITSLLRRDAAIAFKSKGNLHPLILATNLLMAAYSEQKKWPDSFMKIYLEDAGGDRCWSDLEYCREFIENIIWSVGTRKSITPCPDSGLPALPGQPHDSEETAPNKPLKLLDFPAPSHRFRWNRLAVVIMIMDFIKEQLNRKSGAEMINRNFIKMLTSLCGILDVRIFIIPKLEGWLQNTKLVRVSQELLMSICANTTSETIPDVEIISAIIKMRLKTKGLVSSYLACIKELILVHKDNLATALKHTIYHELSSPRNPNNNMAILSTIFQMDPERATKHLALIFLELLYNREDYLVSVKTLLRELGRVLRGDLRLHTLVATLFGREESLPRDADPARSFASVADLGCLAIFLAVMPHARGDKKDANQIEKVNLLVSKMQSEAVNWLSTSAIPVYRPTSQDFINILHKLLLLEPSEVYSKIDTWPEGERSVLLRLATEAPVTDDTLITLLLLGILKKCPLSLQDSLELTEQLVKRAASIPTPVKPVLIVNNMSLVDFVLNAAVYHHPENIDLPSGYCPPQLAITACYWKAWTILLILAAHNPHRLGALAWEKYPTLRTLMEMCITGHFVFPPGYEDHQMLSLEKQRILEFESHLAAATSKVEITEATSLLLPQLISMEPKGPGRRPPTSTLEYIKSLNNSLRLGHLLCRSRDPDFLLDMIQRQGPSQSMPWLADLVHSSDSAHLNMLPVQCLCEFLMSCCPKQESKYQELLVHLKTVVASPEDSAPAIEVLEYFLRRLASPSNRSMAIASLRLILASVPSSLSEDGSMSDVDRNVEDKSDTSWLSQQLPIVPHFKLAKAQIIGCIRAACLVENDPSLVTAYLCFLAEHSIDGLNELSELVLDMATLIVERVTIMMAILPWGSGPNSDQPQTNAALDAFVTIFYNYLTKAREPRRGEYTWSESQDQVLVSWFTGEECTIHILVVHAMVILLTYGCEGVSKVKEYQALLDIWFPQNLDHAPKGFLVDTSEEALLIPDWLKLRMIRSDVPRLVEAALTDLDISQLILFIQSFGIPIPSMSKLLSTLDAVVINQREAVGEAVLDKTYMAQLVEVQHRRGATGGSVFTKVLELELEKHPPDDPPPVSHLIGRRRLFKLSVVPPYYSVKFKDRERKGRMHRPKASLGCYASPRYHSYLRQCLISPIQDLKLFLPYFRMGLISDVYYFKRNGLEQMAVYFNFLHYCLMVRMRGDCNSDYRNFLLCPWMIPLLSFSLRILDFSIGEHMMRFIELLLYEMARYEWCGPFQKMFFKAVCEKMSSRKLEQSESVSKDMLLQPSFVGDGINIIHKALTGLKSKSIFMKGHYVDILAREEPEMIGSYPLEQMAVLFEWDSLHFLPCRPFLLTLLTHHASWATLQTCMDVLLTRTSIPYCDPFAVLDFLQALVRHPKLWQGREKQGPKHGNTDDLLFLTLDQLKCVMDYILKAGVILKREEYNRGPLKDKLFATPHLALVKQCLSRSIDLAGDLAVHLIEETDILFGLNKSVCNQLLVELYLMIPSVITKLDPCQIDYINQMSHISVLGKSTMDVLSHRLLTALSSCTTPGDADLLEMDDVTELMTRSMAAIHPLLTLRQLPLIASSLSGRADLEWPVFKSRGHLRYVQQVSSLLPLLQPHIFKREYVTSFYKVLETYVDIFQNYGAEAIAVGSVNALVNEFTILMEDYVRENPKCAQQFLRSQSEAIKDIQNDYPQMSSFCVCVPFGEESALEVFVLPAPCSTQELPCHWTNKINSIQSDHDQIAGLSYVEFTSGKKPCLLENMIDSMICERLSANSSQVRSLAHTLLARYLRHNPNAARHLVSNFVSLMTNDHPDVVAVSVLRLPDFLVLTQEFGLPLLEELFNLAVGSDSCFSDTILYIIKNLIDLQ